MANTPAKTPVKNRPKSKPKGKAKGPADRRRAIEGRRRRSGADEVLGLDDAGEVAPATVDLRRATPPPPGDNDVIRPTGRGETLMTEVALKIRHPRPPRSLRRTKIGGVAPYIAPKNRLGRWARMRDLGRRGYVPLSPGRRKLRHRILPRTVIGISTMLLMLGIGAAFSGAAFYAYYDNRLAENEQAVSRFVEGFDQQFTDATGAIDDLRVDSISEIRNELRPLGDYVADADGVINLPQSAGPSVWLLEIPGRGR